MWSAKCSNLLSDSVQNSFFVFNKLIFYLIKSSKKIWLDHDKCTMFLIFLNVNLGLWCGKITVHDSLKLDLLHLDILILFVSTSTHSYILLCLCTVQSLHCLTVSLLISETVLSSCLHQQNDIRDSPHWLCMRHWQPDIKIKSYSSWTFIVTAYTVRFSITLTSTYF